MVNDTTLLLDLDGVSVARVEWLADGRRRVHLVTADERARACPACGVFATRVKGSAVTRPRDLPYGASGLEFRRHKAAGGAARPTALAGPTGSASVLATASGSVFSRVPGISEAG